MVSFWLHLLQRHKVKLANILYKRRLFTMYNEGTYRNPLLHYIHNIVFECGLSHLWINQCVNINIDWLKAHVNQTVCNQCIL